LIAWIDSTAPVEVVSHLPDGDIPQPAGGLVWNFYSPQRLMEFEVEVYARACEAYDEALVNSFVRLGWSMSNSAIAPFGVVLEMRHDGDDQVGRSAGLTAMRVPTALLAELATQGPETIWAASRRAVITPTGRERAADRERYDASFERIRAWLAEQNREQRVALVWTTTGADDMSNVRPASSLAAEWLWADLKSVGLGNGVGPNLE
jgi:hypothetical protein